MNMRMTVMGGVDTERRNIGLQHDDDQHEHHYQHHHLRHLYLNAERQEVLRIHGLGFLEADGNVEYLDLCDLYWAYKVTLINPNRSQTH